MVEPAYLYFFACQTLLFTLSLHDFMYEDFEAGEVDERLEHVLSGNSVEGWLSDEIEFMMYGEETEGGKVFIRHISIEEFGDSLVFDWRAKLRQIADSVSSELETSDHDLLLFSSYCLLLARVIQEFRKLINQPPILGSEFYSRHLEFLNELDNMVNRLTDQANADVQPFLGKSNEKSPINVLIQATESLATSWLQSVYSAAEAESTP